MKRACEGCGVDVDDQENYTKLAILKFRRWLCKDCYELQKELGFLPPW